MGAAGKKGKSLLRPLVDLGVFLWSFRGRIGVARYVLTYTALGVFVRPVYYRAREVMTEAGVTADTMAGVVFAVAGSLVVLTLAAAVVRRLHDFNARADWLLAVVAACILFRGGGLLLFFCLGVALVPGTRGANRFGPEPYGLRRFILDARLRLLDRAFRRGKVGADAFNTRRAALLEAALSPRDRSSS